jgi:hypothetical protein
MEFRAQRFVAEFLALSCDERVEVLDAIAFTASEARPAPHYVEEPNRRARSLTDGSAVLLDHEDVCMSRFSVRVLRTAGNASPAVSDSPKSDSTWGLGCRGGAALAPCSRLLVATEL